MGAETKPELDPLRNHPPEVREEDRRIIRLTRFVDLALALIRSGNLSIDEAYGLVARSREAAKSFFPGSGPTFDLLHAPRFRRVIDEVFSVHH